MDKKKDTKKKEVKFQLAKDADNLSAGICGPDGCVLDWSKAKQK